MNNKSIAAREYREHLLNDGYRPLYHFAIPDGNGLPGDPNGAFFADGVYHLMYLYRNIKTNAFHWGHISSVDLLHWHNHEDALTMEDDDEGCFSGGAFLDDDGTAYLTFWKFPSKEHKADNGGIAIACAKKPYEKWERIYPVAIEGNVAPWGTVDVEVCGKKEHISCADPSNIWKMNGKYYMLTGNKCVLDEWGRGDESDPHYRGDWTDLFVSEDLKKWTFVHRFYVNERKNCDWPDETEDNMCPSFLPLFNAKQNGCQTDKWLQLFISHNKGCQYYIGTLDEDKMLFNPEKHGRMSWVDNAFFAPEALIDDKNRHIMWAWLLDDPKDSFNRFGWSGVYSFPRTVWLEDDTLHMAPAEELDKLEYRQCSPDIDSEGNIAVSNGELFRIKAKFDITNQDKVGFKIRVGKDDEAYTEIFYDKSSTKLVMDTTSSGIDGWTVKEQAPLMIENDEELFLDIFVDKSVVEVYANERQAICRRVYPKNPKDAVGVKLIGSVSALKSITYCEIAPTNPY